MSSAPRFDNSYARLPGNFYHRQGGEQVPAPQLIRLNDALAQTLGLDSAWLRSPDGINMLSGNAFPETADPLATVYAGFQFGSWNPQLGDGRALLIGEVVSPEGRRFDIQLKGSGRTPYSRGGDGKSPIGPVIREYLVSEAMFTLGVPTTRALAAISTGEAVYRESPLPGAILTRVASSHIRVGTVQFFSSRKDTESLRQLCNHVIERHYPDVSASDNPIQALLRRIISAQAELIARWQGLGFIHGVMNTDNMLLCGETIDYGPCAFMEAFDPATVFSSIDHAGRYAYGNQPGIGHWNLAGLANALLPLLHDNEDQALELAQTEVNAYPDRFIQAYQQVLANKLGLGEYRTSDDEMIKDLLDIMKAQRSDFTLTFRRLTERVTGSDCVRSLFDFDAAFEEWLARWERRCAEDPLSREERGERMRRANPLFIPRNHQVEKAISEANAGEFTAFQQLLEVTSAPFDDAPEWLDYARPASREEAVSKTFCGT